MQKTQPFSNTIRDFLLKLFARDELLRLARACGAVQRMRDIHPADLIAALISAASGDEERSIATARRAHGDLAGHTVEESAFYTRFSPRLVALLRQLFTQMLARVDVEQRNAVMELMSEYGLKDILAVDGCQVMLPKGAAERFPSTSPDHGGIKLTTTLSVLLGRLQKVALSDAKTHDRRAFKLARWLNGALLIFDRGYSDHRLFADIADRKGFFLSRLKENSVPTVETIRNGLGQAHVGRELDGRLPYRGTVDLDARFRVRGRGTRVFRVVRIIVEKEIKNQGTRNIDVWLVTNLPAEQFSDEQIGLLYRLRWSVEKLFHVMKSVGRLDQLKSSAPDVIHAFVYATLLGTLLAQDICALMRKARPDKEPSLYRVATLLFGRLPGLIEAARDGRLPEKLREFEQALWREGVNPNPGRPYMVDEYVAAFDLAA